MVIIDHQGFDCVVKALRIGRRARLSSWDEGKELLLRGENIVENCILQGRVVEHEWEPDSSSVFMSMEWEILL